MSKTRRENCSSCLQINLIRRGGVGHAMRDNEIAYAVKSLQDEICLATDEILLAQYECC